MQFSEEMKTFLKSHTLKDVLSQFGDLVLDLFGGSGSTLVACEQNNRVCYTMELDPAYCDIIRKRYAILKEHRDDWEDYTKKEN